MICVKPRPQPVSETMWIVAIAWMYVALMMALAEATSPQGSLIGACFTLLLYGVAPLSLVMYVLASPARRRARQRAERQAERQAQQQATPEPPAALTSMSTTPPASAQPDASGLPPADALAPVREEP